MEDNGLNHIKSLLQRKYLKINGSFVQKTNVIVLP